MYIFFPKREMYVKNLVFPVIINRMIPISVLQLKQLSLSSSTLNTIIRGYISMAGTYRRFFTETAADSESTHDSFYAWG